MRDPQKWKIAISRFNGYYANIPSWIKKEEVEDYHTLVTALEEGSGEDLSQFKIPADKIKPKVIGSRRPGYGGCAASVQHSREGYCYSDFFQGQVDGLKHYLNDLQKGPRVATPYDSLSQDQRSQSHMPTRPCQPTKKT